MCAPVTVWDGGGYFVRGETTVAELTSLSGMTTAQAEMWISTGAVCSTPFSIRCTNIVRYSPEAPAIAPWTFDKGDWMCEWESRPGMCGFGCSGITARRLSTDDGVTREDCATLCKEDAEGRPDAEIGCCGVVSTKVGGCCSSHMGGKQGCYASGLYTVESETWTHCHWWNGWSSRGQRRTAKCAYVSDEPDPQTTWVISAGGGQSCTERCDADGKTCSARHFDPADEESPWYQCSSTGPQDGSCPAATIRKAEGYLREACAKLPGAPVQYEAFWYNMASAAQLGADPGPGVVLASEVDCDFAIGMAYETPKPKKCDWQWQWYNHANYRGSRPDCPGTSLGYGHSERAENYFFGSLKECQQACEQNPACDYISRYGDVPWRSVPEDQRSWHCYGYACPNKFSFNLQTRVNQDSYGDGARKAKVLRCTRTVADDGDDAAQHAMGSCDSRLSSMLEDGGFRRLCPCV